MSVTERGKSAERMRVAEPRTRPWTVEEYHRAARAGIFGPEERLELIEGEIFRMTPQLPPHMVAIRRMLSALERIFPESEGWVVLPQMPLRLTERSEPEPDLSVSPGSLDDLEADRLRGAVLVVEVAGTTLRFDRTKKAPLYARAGIPEYWILNLRQRVLEVHRDPDPAAAKYRDVKPYGEAEMISPLHAPNAEIAIRDLLPRGR